MSCTFVSVVTTDWKEGEPRPTVTSATLKVGFEAIDSDDGTAKVVGDYGPIDIIVKLAGTSLHFVQSTREGALYVTTLFARESRPGRFRAVHTRHEHTDVSLPGFTSRPEQYLGDCAMTP